jgi:hypothetical protein
MYKYQPSQKPCSLDADNPVDNMELDKHICISFPTGNQGDVCSNDDVFNCNVQQMGVRKQVLLTAGVGKKMKVPFHRKVP